MFGRIGAFACLAGCLQLLANTPVFAFMDDTPEEKLEAPIPEGVEPIIPLNKDDPTYNIWKK